MNIAPNQVWQYVGPQTPGVPHGQLHQVVFVKVTEIITIGIPFGTGAGWLGPASLFRNHFIFKCEKL